MAFCTSLPFSLAPFSQLLIALLSYAVFYYLIILVRYLVGNIDVAQIKFPWSSSKHRFVPFPLCPLFLHNPFCLSVDPSSSCIANIWLRIGPWKWFLLMGLNDGLANVLGTLSFFHNCFGVAFSASAPSLSHYFHRSSFIKDQRRTISPR